VQLPSLQHLQSCHKTMAYSQKAWLSGTLPLQNATKAAATALFIGPTFIGPTPTSIRLNYHCHQTSPRKNEPLKSVLRQSHCQ
jgi:hypothetical protein